jgi:hypothetical protein
MPLKYDMICRVAGEAGVELWIVFGFTSAIVAKSIGGESLDEIHASRSIFALIAFSGIRLF